ncbi:MAG: NAD(P)H-dependent oxidoreductase subunit E, partial [Anaerolineaceae bacterium]|nr:NAD(P)H-dependent oxidoreductase subunit E [Anaerolineaceae bacterium]
MPRLNHPADLEVWRTQIKSSHDPSQSVITVCCGTGCASAGAQGVVQELQAESEKDGSKVKVKATGCHGFCERGPLVVLYPSKTFYTHVKPQHAAEIFGALESNTVIQNLLYVDPQTQQPVTREDKVQFYHKQQRIVLAKNGLVDPRNIDDYIVYGGYQGLTQALTQLSPVEVIELIKKSG